MKQLSSKQKIIGIVIIAIILAGIITICTAGFNLGINYSNNKKIEIYIGKNYNLSEIKEIANEVLEDKFLLQTVEITDDTVAITVSDATEEQIENLKTKISEKYSISENSQSSEVFEIPGVNLKDIIKPYIFPIILTTIIIAIYTAIRFRKQNVLKVCAKLIGALIVVEALYFSLIAILRIPFNDFVMPISVFIYIVSLIGLIYWFNKKN
jgi:preprotein translocase subunit SecF